MSASSATVGGVPELRVIEERRGHAGGVPANGLDAVLDAVAVSVLLAAPRALPVPDALAGRRDGWPMIAEGLARPAACRGAQLPDQSGVEHRIVR